eukprot:3406658-Alexandrium_andersonii.AAC.1
MCIRDSPLRSPREGHPPSLDTPMAPPARAGGAIWGDPRGGSPRWGEPVSYTHLTLPTICSV